MSNCPGERINGGRKKRRKSYIGRNRGNNQIARRIKRNIRKKDLENELSEQFD